MLFLLKLLLYTSTITVNFISLVITIIQGTNAGCVALFVIIKLFFFLPSTLLYFFR